MITAQIVQLLSSIVGTNSVYAGEVSDSFVAPCLVYAASGYDESLNLDGSKNGVYKTDEYDIDLITKTNIEAIAHKNAMFEILHGFSGDCFGVEIQSIVLELNDSYYDPKIKHWVYQFTLRANY